MATTLGTAIKYPVVCPTLPDISEIRELVERILSSGKVTTGEQVAALESEVCERLEVRNAIAVSSATSGLMLLIRALELPQGSEVITPSFTFAATAHALLWNGLKPVFCDCNADDFTMDANAAEALITENTSAIYPACVFGVPGDIEKYIQLANKYSLTLIFDSAQGLGSTYKGTFLGNFGAGEVFSLSPTKVVTAIEGGLITTNNDSLADKLRRMRDYGKAVDGEDMRWLGLSARMPEINALIGRWSLARINTWISRRASIMEHYRERLRKIPVISFQRIPAYCQSSRNYMVILIDPEQSPVSRDDLYIQLKIRGVQTKRYFYPALHNQTLYCELDPGCRDRLRITEMISSRCLALPMYSHMSLDDADIICDIICKCFK